MNNPAWKSNPNFHGTLRCIVKVLVSDLNDDVCGGWVAGCLVELLVVVVGGFVARWWLVVGGSGRN